MWTQLCGVTEEKKALRQGLHQEKTDVDQFSLAAAHVPRRCRVTWQRGLYAGPNARKDAEDFERSRWAGVSASMRINTAPHRATCWRTSHATLSSVAAADEQGHSGSGCAQYGTN